MANVHISTSLNTTTENQYYIIRECSKPYNISYICESGLGNHNQAIKFSSLIEARDYVEKNMLTGISIQRLPNFILCYENSK